jgi:hypothetical protein
VLRGSQAGLSYERIAGVIEGKGKEKQPTRSGIADGENMVMAGLWSKWKNPANGEEVLSCSVLAKQLLSDPPLRFLCGLYRALDALIDTNGTNRGRGDDHYSG